MKRNWTGMDADYEALMGDIYPQPPDSGHSQLAQEVIHWAFSQIQVKSVIDLGCGEAFCQGMFDDMGILYLGVTVGSDFIQATKAGREVVEMDFNFLDYADDSFDAGLSRHSLEHSPFPVMTLMRWHKVIRRYLVVVLPAPEFYKFGGLNHYSVMTQQQAEFLFSRADWKVMDKEIKYTNKNPDMQGDNFHTPLEYWYILEKA